MKRILVGMFLQMVYTVFCLAESNIGVLQASHTGYSGADDVYQLWGWNILRYYYYLYRHLFCRLSVGGESGIRSDSCKLFGICRHFLHYGSSCLSSAPQCKEESLD